MFREAIINTLFILVVVTLAFAVAVEHHGARACEKREDARISFCKKP